MVPPLSKSWMTKEKASSVTRLPPLPVSSKQNCSVASRSARRLISACGEMDGSVEGWCVCGV